MGLRLQPCSVDQAELYPILNKIDAYRISRRVRLIVNEDSIRPQNGIDEGRLSDIRLADDRDFDPAFREVVVERHSRGLHRDGTVEVLLGVHVRVFVQIAVFFWVSVGQIEVFDPLIWVNWGNRCRSLAYVARVLS